MNKDQVKGDIKKAKGSVGETAAKTLGDEKMEDQGKLQNIEGKFHKSYGIVREAVKK